MPALVVSMLVAASAAFGGQRDHHAATFEGTCQFSGVLSQEPPVTNLPQPGTATARAVGTCSGTLTEKGRVRELDAARSRYFARAQGDISCGGGTAEGRGFLRIRGKKIRFLFSEVRGPGAAAVRLEGRSGGSAAGEARVSDREDPVEIVERCNGAGLSSVLIDIDLATTPALSG